MRQRLKNSDGQMVILMALILPLFLLLMACLANLGLLIHQKIRLQTAVDAGVYSASASLARDLNEIAFLNENINAIYQGDPTAGNPKGWKVTWEDSLKDKLTGDSFNDDDMLQNYFDQYHNLYWKLRGMIDDINQNALEDAEKVGHAAAILTFYNGYVNGDDNEFEFTSLFDGNPLQDGTMIQYTAYGVDESGSYIKTEESGGNPFDPYAGYCENCITEQVGFWIRKESPVYFCAKAKAKSGFTNFWPGLFPTDFAETKDGQIVLTTYAAGQPYGGSVGGYANTYRATLIPIDEKAKKDTDIEFWH